MIAIIGAGISGLSVAWYLHQAGIPYIVLEAGERAGGNIRTERAKGFLLEYGPNSLLADPEVSRMVAEIGLNDRIQPVNPVSKARFIYRNGRYRQLPSSPPGLLFNTFFSFATKWKIFQERGLRSTGPENETVAAFFERRFGREIVDYAVNPFMSGIYAGDPAQLLVSRSFPNLLEMERTHGSVIKGLMQTSKGAARKESYSFKEGMEELPRKMAARLAVRCGQKALEIRREGRGWRVITPVDEIPADRLVLALPTHAAATLIGPLMPKQAKALQQVYYPPLCCLHTAYERSQVRHPLNGFGGLHPKAEQLFSAGSIWSSSLFEGRAPKDKILLTTFVGGTQYAQNATLPDQIIKEKAVAEQQRLYGITGAPLLTNLVRWDKAIPQYDTRILAAEQAIPQLEEQDLYVCANWVGGVSVSDCLKKGREVAIKLAQKAI